MPSSRYKYTIFWGRYEYEKQSNKITVSKKHTSLVGIYTKGYKSHFL